MNWYTVQYLPDLAAARLVKTNFNQNMWDDIVNTIFANLIIFCMSFFRDYNLQAVSSMAKQYI